MQIHVPRAPHTHKNNLPQCSCQLTCWQRRNMIRVAESRSRSVSGLLQLLHSTYLQHRYTSTESHHQNLAYNVILQQGIANLWSWNIVALWQSSSTWTQLTEPQASRLP